MITWFPILWWYDGSVINVVAETDDGERRNLRLTNLHWNLNVRRMYRSDLDIDGTTITNIMTSSRESKVRILWVTSISDIYDRPTQIHAYDGTTISTWNDEPTINLVKKVIEYRPHIFIIDRHEEYVHIVNRSITLWALGRIDSPIPHRRSSTNMWHKIHHDGDGHIHLDVHPITYVPMECSYMPVDQWIWADPHHRSILLHHIDGFGSKVGGPLMTRKIPSWHKIRWDPIHGYTGDYIFDISYYAHTMLDDGHDGSTLHTMIKVIDPSDSSTFMRCRINYSQPLHRMDMVDRRIPILKRCAILHMRYRNLINGNKYIYYSYILNGLHKVAITRSMKKLLANLMKGSIFQSDMYIMNMTSERMAPFCSAFNMPISVANTARILHERYLIDGIFIRGNTITIRRMLHTSTLIP